MSTIILSHRKVKKPSLTVTASSKEPTYTDPCDYPGVKCVVSALDEVRCVAQRVMSKLDGLGSEQKQPQAVNSK